MRTSDHRSLDWGLGMDTCFESELTQRELYTNSSSLFSLGDVKRGSLWCPSGGIVDCFAVYKIGVAGRPAVVRVSGRPSDSCSCVECSGLCIGKYVFPGEMKVGPEFVQTSLSSSAPVSSLLFYCHSNVWLFLLNGQVIEGTWFQTSVNKRDISCVARKGLRSWKVVYEAAMRHLTCQWI